MSATVAAHVDRRGAILLRLARSAIADRLRVKPGSERWLEAGWTEEEWLLRPGACFVTIHVDAALRGCIGTIEPVRPLVEDVRGNAVHAAFHDPRFPPMQADELERAALEVSLLGPMEPLAASSEEAAIAAVTPGEDGLLLTWHGHRGTLLPQVWEALPEPRRFLEALRAKAALPTDAWPDGLVLHRYRVEAWSDAAPGQPPPVTG